MRIRKKYLVEPDVTEKVQPYDDGPVKAQIKGLEGLVRDLVSEVADLSKALAEARQERPKPVPYDFVVKHGVNGRVQSVQAVPRETSVAEIAMADQMYKS